MSPTVFKEKGYRFFFFSRDESRMHVTLYPETVKPSFGLSRSFSLQRTIVTIVSS